MAKLDVEFIAPFITATQKTFGMMTGDTIARKKVYVKEGYRMHGDISAMIGLSGTTTGTAAISLPGAMAMRAVETMTGEKLEGGLADAAVHDGVGELINMIAGQAKATLATTRYKFDITLPTIISGSGHEIYRKKGTQCVLTTFETGHGEPFTLEVCLPETN